MEKVKSYLELSVLLYRFVVSYLLIVELLLFQLIYINLSNSGIGKTNIFHLSAMSGEMESVKDKNSLFFSRN